MTFAAKVLVVDDEAAIRRLLRGALTRAGYVCIEASDARGALTSANIDKPDVILLDLGLPDRDGLELIPQLRTSGSAKILVITARVDTPEKVAALDLGADDYVTKPFDTDELLARVRALLRQRLSRGTERPIVTGCGLEIDLMRRVVARDGMRLHLTPKEYGVLAELARAPGRVITHRHLLTNVWGPAQVERSEYLRVVMRSLRQKLEAEPQRPMLLINEPGVGYRLQLPEPS